MWFRFAKSGTSERTNYVRPNSQLTLSDIVVAIGAVRPTILRDVVQASVIVRPNAQERVKARILREDRH